MKLFLFLCLSLSVCPLLAGDWTCEECDEGGAALGDWLASPDNLIFETDVLLEAICPSHPQPDYCREKLPGFWGQVGPVVMREHYGQLCDDLEECQSHSQARLAVPSCEACTNRIGLRADFLGAEETIVLWTSTLMEWCAGQEAGEVQECQEAVQWGVPLALPALSQADRGWVQGFCIVWTACSP